ncbi:MAG: DNA repair protein RadA, partial [Clostridiales bacterium]|nr:DNA repair protein RadA [Clostridiales bacterium]
MKTKTVYVCNECGAESTKWQGKCPYCGTFNSLTEEALQKPAKVAAASIKKPERLHEIKPMSEGRITTKITELDRVLSGGIVNGSLILVGGDPGIGKSTLLLQICQSIGGQNKQILYVSGEESNSQIKLRAERLSITTNNLLLLPETNIAVIEEAIMRLNPDLVIIDSIQTMYREEIASVPGSISQVREGTQAFMKIAKNLNITVIIVGHVTKEGSIAGPKILEHMVDTVLYFEGEKRAHYRIIRAVKNRFGATDEIGVFEMGEKGLQEIKNPSEYMLLGRPLGVPGSAVACNIEGTRPILSEVQALV